MKLIYEIIKGKRAGSFFDDDLQADPIILAALAEQRTTLIAGAITVKRRPFQRILPVIDGIEKGSGDRIIMECRKDPADLVLVFVPLSQLQIPFQHDQPCSLFCVLAGDHLFDTAKRILKSA